MQQFSFLLLIHFQTGTQSCHHFAVHIANPFRPLTYFLFSCCIKTIYIVLLFNTIYFFIHRHTCVISTPSTYITKNCFASCSLFISFLIVTTSPVCFLTLPQYLLPSAFSQYCVWSKMQCSQIQAFILIVKDGRQWSNSSGMDTARRKEDNFKSLLSSIPASLYTVKSLADKRKPKGCVHFAVIWGNPQGGGQNCIQMPRWWLNWANINKYIWKKKKGTSWLSHCAYTTNSTLGEEFSSRDRQGKERMYHYLRRASVWQGKEQKLLLRLVESREGDGCHGKGKDVRRQRKKVQVGCRGILLTSHCE